MFKEKLIEKIKSNIIIDSNGCWLWNKALTTDGYGITFDGIESIRVHILVAKLFLNYVPVSGKQINHKCDVKSCCNPEHIYIGTQSQNRSDSWRKKNKKKPTHCKKKHLLSPDNTRLHQGKLDCLTCEKLREKKRIRL